MQVITYGLGDGGIKCWGTGLSKQETEGGNVKARLECFPGLAIDERLEDQGKILFVPRNEQRRILHMGVGHGFIPRHKEYLPLIFKALIDGQAGMKARAGMALCAFVKGRLNWLRETDKAIKDCQATDTAEDGEKVRSKAAVEAWKKARKVAQESQISAQVSTRHPPLTVLANVCAQDYLTTTVKQTRADAERIAVWDAIVVLLTKDKELTKTTVFICLYRLWSRRYVCPSKETIHVQIVHAHKGSVVIAFVSKTTIASQTAIRSASARVCLTAARP
jgi:hypothetical protein